MASAVNSNDHVASETLHGWEWAQEARANGALNSFAGQHVVVVGKCVAAANADFETAIAEAVAKTGAARRELVVLFIDDPDSEGWLYAR